VRSDGGIIQSESSFATTVANLGRPFGRSRPVIFHRLRSGPLWVVIVVAVLLRVAVMARGTGAFADPDNYLAMAQSLAHGDGFALDGRATAYRPPLYPLLLAPLCLDRGVPAVWGVAVLHLALGAGTVWLTAVAAKGSGLSTPRVTLAAFITACDPVLVWQSRSVMTETPAAFFHAAALAALCLPGWPAPVLGGIALGLAALCRPSSLSGAVLIILAALLVRPGESKARLVRGGLLAISVVAVLSPWAIRNALALGTPIWTTTHGGYTLALANNPVYYREVVSGPPGRVWTGADQWLWWHEVNLATTGMSEPEADRFLRAQVWSLVRERPRDFGRATLARLVHFWSVAPASSVYPPGVRWATMAWTVIFWAALVLGLLQRGLWRWPRIAAPLVAIGLSLVHTLFWTDLRMRAPIVPALALIAAGAAFPLGRDRARDQGACATKSASG
jgi:Dolichyl-phosphate-mannose-protein mannosyltransferase